MMKITLISDVHGNLPALEAVLRHARARGAADKIINLGDLTGYGPFPEQVVRWSQAPHIISLLGDYDQKVLSEQHRQTGWQRVNTTHKREMFAWTYQALSKGSRKYLRTLPESQTIEVEGVKLLLSHGSPAGHHEFTSPDRPAEDLIALAASSDTAIVLSGHTHQAFSCELDGILYINPGTVGRVDDGDPRASYAILAIDQGDVEVQFYRVPYNIMAAVHAIRGAGLPEVFTQVIRRGLSYDDVVPATGSSPVLDELEPCGTVTLLTDFNLMDPYVGVMKGVIADIAPHASLIDISHQVRPQSIIEGARMLAQAVPYFPAGTVHIAVVDPGVGTARRALAARIGEHFFVAPDNGLLTVLLEKSQMEGQSIQLISLTKPEYWLPQVSAIFHGRDIFAPVGAHLANGIPLTNLGEVVDDPHMLTLAQPVVTSAGWEAAVVLVDGFGNICTNLPGEAILDHRENLTIKIGGETIRGLTHTLGAALPGTLIALVDSAGYLAIAVVNGNAAQRLNVHIGAPVTVEVVS